MFFLNLVFCGLSNGPGADDDKPVLTSQKSTSILDFVFITHFFLYKTLISIKECKIHNLYEAYCAKINDKNTDADYIQSTLDLFLEGGIYTVINAYQQELRAFLDIIRVEANKHTNNFRELDNQLRSDPGFRIMFCQNKVDTIFRLFVDYFTAYVIPKSPALKNCEMFVKHHYDGIYRSLRIDSKDEFLASLNPLVKHTCEEFLIVYYVQNKSGCCMLLHIPLDRMILFILFYNYTEYFLYETRDLPELDVATIVERITNKSFNQNSNKKIPFQDLVQFIVEIMTLYARKYTDRRRIDFIKVTNSFNCRGISASFLYHFFSRDESNRNVMTGAFNQLIDYYYDKLLRYMQFYNNYTDLRRVSIYKL